MLVLTRKRNEEIIIGDDIVVTVVDIKRNTVIIGIEEAKDIPIHRKEVYNRLLEQGFKEQPNE